MTNRGPSPFSVVVRLVATLSSVLVVLKRDPLRKELFQHRPATVMSQG